MKTHTSPVEWRMPSAIAARLPRLCENWMHTRLGCRLRAAQHLLPGVVRRAVVDGDDLEPALGILRGVAGVDRLADAPPAR